MRIALFGGTFDPVHSAHLTVALEAESRFALDRVLLVPAANPPHKAQDGIVPFVHRFRMVELACVSFPSLEASALEASDGTSYSIDTVQRLRQDYPEPQPLFFLIGADAFSEIATWHRWRELMEQVEFIVVTRPGHDYETPEGAKVHRLETLALPVSSSEIRNAIASGDRPSELPGTVWAYIQEHKLYRR